MALYVGGFLDFSYVTAHKAENDMYKSQEKSGGKNPFPNCFNSAPCEWIRFEI